MLRRDFLIGAGAAAAVPAFAGRAKRRALVLGGGGPVGEAWECGLLYGLNERGFDFSRADLVLGTSAGATTGARLAKDGPLRLMDPSVLAPPESFGRASPPGTSPPERRDMSPFVAGLRAIDSDKCPACVVRSKLGSWAMSVPPLLPESAFVESFQQRLQETAWPRRFQCVAVDAMSGLRQVWTQRSGVALASAVAASAAVPGLFAPVTIGKHRYMDGGLFSPTNADLASGCSSVVILAPTLGQQDEVGLLFARAIRREATALRQNGARVVVIAPDSRSLAAFGSDLGNSRQPDAVAEAGHRQSHLAGEQVRAIWRSA